MWTFAVLPRSRGLRDGGAFRRSQGKDDAVGASHSAVSRRHAASTCLVTRRPAGAAAWVFGSQTRIALLPTWVRLLPGAMGQLVAPDGRALNLTALEHPLPAARVYKSRR